MFFVRAAKKASEVSFSTSSYKDGTLNFEKLLSGGHVGPAESARCEKYRICVSGFSA